jgi:membrane dipeptidase
MFHFANPLNIDQDELERSLDFYAKSISFDSLLGVDQAPFSEEMVRRFDEMMAAKRSLSEISRALKKIELAGLARNTPIKEEYARAWEMSGLTAASITISSGDSDLPAAVEAFAEFSYRIDILRDIIIKATCADDILRAKREGKRALVCNVQNTVVLAGSMDLEKQLDTVDLFYRYGVRIWQLTYNLRNLVGDGCTERNAGGLTHFGEKVVKRMNDLHILIDVSHCGHKTTLDAVEKSEVPVAATHTGCKGVYDHARGKTDKELKAIADKGGYVGIYMVPAFLAQKATLKDWLDHVDYVVDLVGCEHVGIGTDNWYRSPRYPMRLAQLENEKQSFWNGFRPEHGLDFTAYPAPLDSEFAWTNWPYFAAALANRGYSDQEIKGIIGENFLHLFERVVG